ncbi:MAG: CoA pyrophosphatase [Deltaproteobacteria bacterium]|nr:CoA pyrophosphatase [Deltaproteobacteria bacterium]
MNANNLSDRDETHELILKRLGTAPVDFSEQFSRVRTMRTSDRRWLAAGVLLPLFFRENETAGEGEFVFQLIKRSRNVPQSGDLSAPGGMLNPLADKIFMNLIISGIFPMLRGGSRKYLRQRSEEKRDVVLFLANALRESWEEVRLNPFNVRFLGALPSYTLSLFPRVIFPVVGLVRTPWRFRPNWEVEKVVEIPLAAFFRDENYAFFSLSHHGDGNGTSPVSWQFPCLIHREPGGNDEILWGATFNIILSFLKAVFDHELPEIDRDNQVHRTIDASYMTGSAHGHGNRRHRE